MEENGNMDNQKQTRFFNVYLCLDLILKLKKSLLIYFIVSLQGHRYYFVWLYF